MSDLQDAIDNVADFDFETQNVWGLEKVVDAARMWLNPNIEAVEDILDDLWMSPGDRLRSEWAAMIVAAALTPGDTDER